MKQSTERMLVALRIAGQKRDVCAGLDFDHVGRSARIYASSLRALARRGLVTLHIGTEGGMAASITEAGRDTLVLLNSDTPFLACTGLTVLTRGAKGSKSRNGEAAS